MGVFSLVCCVCVMVGVLVVLVCMVLVGCMVSLLLVFQSIDMLCSILFLLCCFIQIIMGIDWIGFGFNLYLLFDLLLVNVVISVLVLFSVFWLILDFNMLIGLCWEMDLILLVFVDVINNYLFMVIYKIWFEVQWMDNVLIVVDDFWYLWQQMVIQLGVVDFVGYYLIISVQLFEGGKQVVVMFVQFYFVWCELFIDILLVYIVKDILGGFVFGLV